MNNIDGIIIDDRLNEALFDECIEEQLASQLAININSDLKSADESDNESDDESEEATTEDVVMVIQSFINVNITNDVADSQVLDNDNNVADFNTNDCNNDNINDNNKINNKINNNDDTFRDYNNILYPMHYAVFHRDIFIVENLLENMMKLEDYDINDNMNNTPLMLSVKLGFNEISYLLLQYGFNFNVKSRDGYHLLDEALLASRDYRLIREIYIKMQNALVKKWTDNVETLLATMSKIPDFYIEMTWKFEAKGLLRPLIALLNPRDTYKIYKKGNFLRIDSSIAGLRKGFGLNPIKRGAVSLLLIGDNPDAHFSPGELIKIDHDSKKYKRLIDRMKNPNETIIQQNVSLLMANSKKQNKTDTLSFDIDNVSFAMDTVKSEKEKPLKWQSSKWLAEGDVAIISHSKTCNVETKLSSTEYFEFIENDNESTHDSNGDINENVISNHLKHTSLLNKRMKAKLYLTEELPISMTELMPIMEVLTFDEKKFEPLLKLFNETKKVDMKGFPIKTKVSLLLGVSLTLTVDEFEKYEIKNNQSSDINNIGSDYIDDTLST